MVEKGALSPVREQRDGFLSSIFVVPKKEGGGGGAQTHNQLT